MDLTLIVDALAVVKDWSCNVSNSLFPVLFFVKLFGLNLSFSELKHRLVRFLVKMLLVILFSFFVKIQLIQDFDSSLEQVLMIF